MAKGKGDAMGLRSIGEDQGGAQPSIGTTAAVAAPVRMNEALLAISNTVNRTTVMSPIFQGYIGSSEGEKAFEHSDMSGSCG